MIPRNIKLSEAPSFGKPILLYDHLSIGAKKYTDFAQEFLKNNEKDLQEKSPDSNSQAKMNV